MIADNPHTESFITLIKEQERLIYKVCSLYATQGEDRKDLFQEIVVQAWTTYPRFRQDARPGTWLYRVALNTAINYRRSSKKHINISEPGWLNELEDADAAALDEEYKIMQRLIEDLPAIEKALVLLYIEDYSHQEIASIIGMSVTNVGTRLMRVKEKLKKQAQQLLIR